MRKEKLYAVAIDGPAGAGKSSIAKAVAGRCGYLYVDTGAIYRTVGLAVRRTHVDPHDEAAVASILPSLSIRLDYGADGTQRMFLNGEDVSAPIRSSESSLYASAVSTLPAVRTYLLDQQRDMAHRHSVVMDGRDIGTVVLPEADLKIFLTATLQARAKRRFAELQARGESVALDDVLADMAARDEQDATRAAAPLRAAEDAVLVDTTNMSLEESIAHIFSLVRAHCGTES